MSTATPQLAPATKTCSGCHLDLPLDSFRSLSKETGRRDSRCNECHRRDMNALNAKRRVGRLGPFATKLKRAQRPSQAEAAVAMMIEKFGGIEKFVQFWKEQLDAVSMSKPGSRLALHSCMGVANVIALTSKLRPDLSDVSDEGLERELAQMRTRLGQ